MGQVAEITKAERRRAISRTKKFRAEFAEKPEHAVDLGHWYYDYDDSQHCGVVGCVGGYAEYSPLMKAYRVGMDRVQLGQSLYSFFGLTDRQADKRNLFDIKLWSDKKSDKAEGLARLDSLIKYHLNLLEA